MGRSEYFPFGIVEAGIAIDALNHFETLRGEIFQEDEFADIVEQAGHESIVGLLLAPSFPIGYRPGAESGLKAVTPKIVH
jgi:hypothetical protein